MPPHSLILNVITLLSDSLQVQNSTCFCCCFVCFFFLITIQHRVSLFPINDVWTLSECIHQQHFLFPISQVIILFLLCYRFQLTPFWYCFALIASFTTKLDIFGWNIFFFFLNENRNFSLFIFCLFLSYLLTLPD